MAPTKQGLDYFRHALGMLNDRKLRKAKMRFGTAATVVYLALLELIYGDKGYYILYNDDVVWDILQYLQGAYCPSAETVKEIVADLVACELFDGDQFKSKILTSKRVQKEFYNSTVDRKAVAVDFSIWLLSESEMRAISGKSFVLHKFLNLPNSPDNRPNSRDNPPNCPQSTVEYSTGEKSTGEAKAAAPPLSHSKEISDLIAYADTQGVGGIGRAAAAEMEHFLGKNMTADMVRYAIDEAAIGSKPWVYAKAVLTAKLKEGVLDPSMLPAKQSSISKKTGEALDKKASYNLEEFERTKFFVPKIGHGEEDSFE